MVSNREDIMNDSLNPFDRVTENPEHPLARIYRESFWRGIADTYDVLIGNHYRMSYNEDTHAGVLDILIFPLLSQWLMRIAFPTLKHITYQEPPKEYRREVLTHISKDGSRNYDVFYDTPGAAPMLIRLVAGFFACLLEVPRAIIGAGLTLIASPIVAMVHAILSYKANKLKNEVKNLEIVEQESRCDTTITVTKKLREFLHHEYTTSSGEQKSYDENLTDISANTDSNTYVIDREGKFERQFTLKENNDATQIQSVKAFEELNIGGRRIR